jgi:hypothetical protein
MEYGTLRISSINGSGLVDNLLINPEFTINQRAAAAPTTTVNAYNFDRWYYDGTFLYQGIENVNLRNTTYSISWAGSATCSYSLNAAASTSQNSQSYTSVDNTGQIVINSLGSNHLWIRFSQAPAWAKVEHGTASTVYIPRDVTSEYNLCFRYYERQTCYPQAKGAQYNSNSWYFTFNFRQFKRVAPTMSASISQSWPRISTSIALATSNSPLDGGWVAASAEL